MQLARNFIAGLASSSVSVLVGLAVVPVYLHFLGVEPYGLIGFYLMLQSLLQVFDLGLTATVNREVARTGARADGTGASGLVQALAWVALGIAAVITIALVLLAPVLAASWLQLGQMALADATAAMVIMALALGLRWPIGLYQAVLMGAERIVLCSQINIVMALVAHGGAAALVAWGGADVRGFFAWQALAGVLHLLAMRTAAWRTVPAPPTRWPDLRELRRVGKFSLTLVAIGIVALVFTQTDKLILSRLLPLEVFGRYMLASLVAGGLYALVTPVFNAVYPRFSAMATSADPQALRQLYRTTSHLLACLLLPLAAFLAVSGESLLRVWTGDATLAAAVAPTLALLGVGSALHGIMFVPYALTLALGAARLALGIQCALLLTIGPLMLLLTLQHGVLGAAWAWVVLHVAYLVLGGFVTHRALLPGLALRWLLGDIGLPVLVAVLMAVFGALAPMDPGRGWVAGAAGALWCLGAWAVLALLSPRLRAAFRQAFLKSGG